MIDILQNVYFITLVVLLITVFMIQMARRSGTHEGFEQKAPFVLKNGNDIYDSFYAIVYDDLNKTKEGPISSAIKLSS